MTKYIELDESDPTIPVIALNRPEKKNAMSLDMWRELTALFESFAKTDGVRAIVLTGRGGSFSAGADISEFGEVRHTPEQSVVYNDAVEKCLDSIGSSPAPVIAAITGPCVGGGMGLATICDLRIASPSAYFSVPAARMGLVYGTPGIRALAAAVGYVNAKRILFTALRFDATQAERWGYVQDVADDPLLAARKLAAACARGAPLAVRGMKKIICALAEGKELPDDEAQEIVEQAAGSRDHKAAVAAFSTGQEPRFEGR